MSQSSSQALDPSWMSVSFAKFSHNSSPLGTRNFTWVHVGSRNDLDFILRNTRFVHEAGTFYNRLFMKISAGAEELEQQDLYELFQHMQAFDPSSGSENPVQVVVKSPFLAMRYPKSATIVRRIQLKFHNDTDFTRVLNFLKDLGLPITDQNPAPSSALPLTIERTSTPSSIFRPASSCPSLLSDTSSAISMTSASSSTTRLSLPPPGPAYPEIRLRIGQFQNLPDSVAPEFKVPPRPSSSFSQLSKTTPILPFMVPHISRPHTASSFFPSAGLGMPQNLVNAPSSIYVSQMERESQSRRASFPAIKGSQETPRPNLELYQSQTTPHNYLVPTPRYPGSQLSRSPFFEPRSTSTEIGMNEAKISDQDRGRQGSETPVFLGRNAALFDTAQFDYAILPPKRELPFPKPREIKIRSASVSTIAPLPESAPAALLNSAIISTLQPKNKADEDRAPVIKTTNKRVAQRKSTARKVPDIVESPLPEQSNVKPLTSATPPSDEPSPLAAKSLAAVSRPASALPGLPSKAAAPQKRAAPTRPSSVAKRAKMIDQSTQTKMFSIHYAKAKLPLVANHVPDLLIAQPAAPTAAPPAFPESFLDTVDTFVAKHAGRSEPKEIWEQTGWADADEDQRQLLLNSFICENLENKDFLQLCEDMRLSWRRIAAGF